MMKKVLVLAFLLAGTGAFAGIDYGLDAGQTRLGVYGGMSAPGDWSWSGTSVAPGGTGGMFGAEFIRNIVPMASIGIDANYASYGKKSSSAGTVDSNVFGVHLTGRVNFFPEMPTRIYIPVGVGMSEFNSHTDGLGNANQAGLSAFGGFGVEFDLSPVWTLGLEGRYFYMGIDRDKFGDDKFTSVNMLVKLGARF